MFVCEGVDARADEMGTGGRGDVDTTSDVHTGRVVALQGKARARKRTFTSFRGQGTSRG